MLLCLLLLLLLLLLLVLVLLLPLLQVCTCSRIYLLARPARLSLLCCLTAQGFTNGTKERLDCFVRRLKLAHTKGQASLHSDHLCSKAKACGELLADRSGTQHQKSSLI